MVTNGFGVRITPIPLQIDQMMSGNGKIRRAPGFDDRAGKDFERIDASVRAAREVLYARGYEPIETPLIEQTELFLRRSGGLLSSQLFDFLAPDGSNISLRPELTAPVVRHAVEQTERALPMRFQYASPIFRYTERPYDAPASTVPSKRQFTQIGAELVGSSQAHADGEIVAAAYALAKRLGVEDVSIRIGHVGLIRDILGSFRLSERARLFLADSVSDLASGSEGWTRVESEAVRLGLMPSEGQQSIETQASAASLLSRLASGSIRLPETSENTSRTAEDIVAGLRRKVEWDASNVDFPKAMSMMSKVSQLSGRAESERRFGVIDQTSRLIEEFDLGELPNLDNLASVVNAVAMSGVDRSDMIVDLGLSASIAYYSGMIFEVRADINGEDVVIGGGGRYDGLASALGSETELPALGFALNLDSVLEMTASSNNFASKRNYIILCPINSDAIDQVVERAAELRDAGENVISLFEPSADTEAVAASTGNARVIRIGQQASNEDES